MILKQCEKNIWFTSEVYFSKIWMYNKFQKKTTENNPKMITESINISNTWCGKLFTTTSLSIEKPIIESNKDTM
jgi:hypothetical protein